MADCDTERVLVVGGTGRVGGLLVRAWALTGQGGIIWQRRVGDGAGPRFDPLAEPAAFAAAAEGALAVLNLAGRVGGTERDYADHAALALAALNAARKAGVAWVFLASSAAVYGQAECATEDAPLAPVTPYGRAKAHMEDAARQWVAAHPGGPGVTCLRIANVAGADALLGAAPGPGPQMLDVFPDGTGPRRSYLGPLALAGILSRLVGHVREGGAMPEVLNVALDGAVAMAALLDADGRVWAPRPASQKTLPVVRLDVTRLCAVTGPLPPADAGSIVADLRSTLAEAR